METLLVKSKYLHNINSKTTDKIYFHSLLRNIFKNDRMAADKFIV